MKSTRWKNNKVPTAILSSLATMRGIGEDGKLFFKGFAFDQLAAALTSHLEFAPEISDHDKLPLVLTALFATAKKPDFSSKNIITEIAKASRAQFTAVPQKYLLVTSISVKLPSQHLIRTVGNCIVRFRPALPKYISENSFSEMAKNALDAPLPSSYAYAVISTEGRSLAEAGSNALDAIDFIRGVWNFPLIPSFRMSFGKRQSVNAIVLGPLQLLHRPDGSIIKELCWIDPTYVTAIVPRDLKADWSKVSRFERDVKKRFSFAFLSQLLQEAFRRYARALDERDFDVGFTKLWSLFEFLTQTTKDSYDTSIKRAAFLYSDRDTASEVMNHLRDMRNRRIHSGRSNPQGEILVYQMKKFVEDLILFYMRGGKWFSSLEEIRDFLDLPPSTQALLKRKRLIELGIRFMKPRPTTIT